MEIQKNCHRFRDVVYQQCSKVWGSLLLNIDWNKILLVLGQNKMSQSKEFSCQWGSLVGNVLGLWFQFSEGFLFCRYSLHPSKPVSLQELWGTTIAEISMDYRIALVNLKDTWAYKKSSRNALLVQDQETTPNPFESVGLFPTTSLKHFNSSLV